MNTLLTQRQPSHSPPTHPMNHHHHRDRFIPIDFRNALQVPDSHSWSSINITHDDNHSSNTQTVPVVDLEDPINSINGVRKACEKWGVFHVTNHGVPYDLLERVEHQTRRLFALPDHRKLRTLRSPGSLSGYGLARITPFFRKLMWSEGFTIAGSPLEHARQLWPQDFTTFCNTMEEYQQQMKRLSGSILSIMLSSLGLTREDADWVKPKTPQHALQLNHYPICPDPTRAMGLAPHTDSSLFTLLLQSNTPGLQVHRDNGGWSYVKPVSGTVVVIVGDLMHVLSNGLYRSALHRAVVNKTQHRVSIAYFYGPPRNVQVSPCVKLIDQGQSPLYRAVAWKEYLDIKNIHFNRALEIIELEPKDCKSNEQFDVKV